MSETYKALSKWQSCVLVYIFLSGTLYPPCRSSPVIQEHSSTRIKQARKQENRQQYLPYPVAQNICSPGRETYQRRYFSKKLLCERGRPRWMQFRVHIPYTEEHISPPYFLTPSLHGCFLLSPSLSPSPLPCLSLSVACFQDTIPTLLPLFTHFTPTKYPTLPYVFLVLV